MKTTMVLYALMVLIFGVGAICGVQFQKMADRTEMRIQYKAGNLAGYMEGMRDGSARVSKAWEETLELQYSEKKRKP